MKGRREEWKKKEIEVIGEKGKEIRIMKKKFYLGVWEEMGIKEDKMEEMFKRKGFLGIWYMMRNLKKRKWKISIWGFRWKGWKKNE